MFEKEAEEYFETECLHSYADTEEQLKEDVVPAFQKGAEFGYNKAKEEARLLLKDDGIVKLLKDSILRNERLSRQEQQELCAWIECAMDFGENLDECAKELEAQIEKMKCCENCKYKYIQDNADLGEGTRTDPCLSCRSHNMWEFEE